MESMLRPSVTWDKIVSTSMVWLNGDDLASIRRCMDSSGPFREEQFWRSMRVVPEGMLRRELSSGQFLEKECEVRAEYMKVDPERRVRKGVSDDTVN